MNSIDDSPPLVSLAILTYNQRNFVIDAIKGALAQDYENLEIIVSDDCSTDDTYALVESFVKSYTGPHKLIINQTSNNKCILGHFFDVVDVANGRLLLLSAGDDISHPERVSETVSTWQKEGAVGLYSNYDLIDQSGSIIERNFSPNASGPGVDKIFGKPLYYEMHGASSAYDLEFVRSLPRPDGRFFFEDSFMTFMIKLHGEKISKIDKPLVAYRSHGASLSNNHFSRRSFNDFWDGERSAEFYSGNKHDLYLFLVEYASTFRGSTIQAYVDSAALENYRSRLRIKGQWTSLSFFERLRNIFVYRGDSGLVRWMTPRIFGLKFFSILRYMRDTRFNILKKNTPAN